MNLFYVTFTVYSLPLKSEDYSVAGLVSKKKKKKKRKEKKRKEKNK